MDLDRTLADFFEREAALDPGDSVAVAYSGGGDSTALLAGLEEFSRGRRLSVEAIHVDHGLDRGSAGRAESARLFAERRGVSFRLIRREVGAERRPGESLEMASRRVRYRELERAVELSGARYLATAHHLDDQAETVLLRIAAGHGLPGTAGIPARRGRIIRPLLGLSRRDLDRWLAERRYAGVDDPGNRVLTVPRNRTRHLVLPRLEAQAPGLSARLANLARRARRANSRVGELLDRRLRPRASAGSALVERTQLEALPSVLVPYALNQLLRRAGASRQPSRAASAAFYRQLAAGARVGVDLGNGWRIEQADGRRLRVRGPRTTGPDRPFAYTLSVPGEVYVGEISSSVRLRRARRERWMFEGSPSRAGLALPAGTGNRLLVRNRRPGDRVQPLGSAYRRKLKDVLIDRGVPRSERDRLPLLCDSERVLWVPGVTIDHEARIRERTETWLAEIIRDE